MTNKLNNTILNPGAFTTEDEFIQPGDYIIIEDELGVLMKGEYLGYNHENNWIVLKMPKSFTRHIDTVRLPFPKSAFRLKIKKESNKKMKAFNQGNIIDAFYGSTIDSEGVETFTEEAKTLLIDLLNKMYEAGELDRAFIKIIK